MRVSALLPLVLLLPLANCAKSQYQAPDPNCRGANCASYTGVRYFSCEQFDPKKPNLAFFGRRTSSDFTEPIHVYYSVIQRNMAGTQVNETPEAHVRLVDPGLNFGVCYAARAGTTEVYTQELRLKCQTNRSMASGTSSSDCTAAERMDVTVKPFLGNLDASLLSKTLRTQNEILAPAGLAPDEEVDCVAACKSVTGTPCIRIGSAALNAKLLNFVETWQPGSAVTKSAALAALGASDSCERSDALVSQTGAVRNTGPTCEVEVKLGDETFKLVFGDVSGRGEDADGGKRVLFDPGRQPDLRLSKGLEPFGREVYSLSAPKGSRVAYMRTATACVQVHEY